MELAIDIADSVEEDIIELDIIPTVEVIQDMVEEYLMGSERKEVAKRYILYREERNKLRNQEWEMNDLQRDIYEKKYRYNNESFDEFLNRVSGGNKDIKELIRNKKFSPAGRILANRGLNKKGIKVSYSNCFVNSPPDDSLESIFDVAKDMARTYSYSGGVGITLKNLRPRGGKVNNSAKETTGAVSFADLYSLTTGLIGQNNRRGALMLTLPIEHPDIEEFIDVKNDLNRINFANISVQISDEFMEAVKNDKNWVMRFEVKDTGEVIEKTTSAKKLFRKIAENNWRQAEPGSLYWQHIKDYHINSHVEGFEYSATNP